MIFSKNEPLSHLVMKEVRYHYLIYHLLAHLSEIKIIGIVRNPCAVINSWMSAPREFKAEWKQEEEWRFAPSKNDFKIEEYNGFEKWKELTLSFLEMELKFPKQFTVVTYENLVVNTEFEIKRLFQFSELEFTTSTLDFIQNSKNFKGNGAYSVFRLNPDTDNWKHELRPEISKEIMKLTKEAGLEKFLQ